METHAPGIRKTIDALPEKPSIHIYPDGRFTATNFPYFEEVRHGFEYRFKDLREIQSRWTIGEGGTVENGWDEPRQCYGIRLDLLPPHLSFAGFTGIEKVDGIIFTFGDPDSGDAIIFKKLKK